MRLLPPPLLPPPPLLLPPLLLLLLLLLLPWAVAASVMISVRNSCSSSGVGGREGANLAAVTGRG